MSDIQCPETTPCANCRTTKGLKKQTSRNGPPRYRRYSGERFGYDAELCETCYARATRHSKAIAAGRVPGRPGPRRVHAKKETRATSLHVPKAAIAKCVSPVEVAVRLREIQDEKVQLGLRAPAGETPVELQQRHWAGLASAERRSAAASRSNQRKQVAI